MGGGDFAVTDSFALCHRCGYDLRAATIDPIIGYDVKASEWHAGLCKQVTEPMADSTNIGLDVLAVMRQLTMLLTSRYANGTLHEHICHQIGVPELNLSKGRIATETRPLIERHHLLQLVAWLMVDLKPRLSAAWRSKAVRYNHLLKDFEDSPLWYREVVDEFSNWRIR